jgi:hypothetical protein
MNFKSLENKYLKVGSMVKLTPFIDIVIAGADEYFKDCPARVTSGLRGPDDQLRIIRTALIQRGLDKQYKEAFGMAMSDRFNHEGTLIYGWQLGWSKLLNMGYIVNPPFDAKVLMDYFRPGSSKNKKGQIIGQSPHANGTAFDVGGGNDGIASELACLERALNDHLPGLKGFLAERANNAIHVDCEGV